MYELPSLFCIAVYMKKGMAALLVSFSIHDVCLPDTPPP